MRRYFESFLIALPVIIIFALVFWWEYSLWDECRETNSFWYCVRVLGK